MSLAIPVVTNVPPAEVMAMVGWLAAVDCMVTGGNNVNPDAVVTIWRTPSTSAGAAVDKLAALSILWNEDKITVLVSGTLWYFQHNNVNALHIYGMVGISAWCRPWGFAFHKSIDSRSGFASTLVSRIVEHIYQNKWTLDKIWKKTSSRILLLHYICSIVTNKRTPRTFFSLRK